MRLICVGCNWKTPVALRERLAIEPTRLPDALDRLRKSGPGLECAILSTCNRTEIYLGSSIDSGSRHGLEELGSFLADLQAVPFEAFREHLYLCEDEQAAQHLFCVAAGLDSLILGEVQILGQTKEAYHTASAAGAVGPVLHPLFQKAFNVAKRVQTDTTLSKGRLSIASAAVEYVKGVFEDFRTKTVLIVGAGKMAELTLTHLREHRLGRLLLCNRSRERADALALKFGGEVRPFESLHEALVEADVVISSTGAEEAIVRADEFHAIAQARRGRHMAIIDIAVPRDFDPAIEKFENVFLWNIDHLERVRHQTWRTRERAFDQAMRLVEQELAAFQTSVALQQTGPVLSKLDVEMQRVMEEELSWLFPQLNGMADVDRAKIRQFASRIKNKIQHPIRAAIRKEAEGGGHQSLVEAVRKLFGL
jgi:glutamyl-tRNA reductase